MANSPQAPDRNLALELVRVTEAAAIAANRWMGRGEKNAADDAAVEAMRVVLNSISMTGTVIIGEGEKDEAPMLYNGEVLGDGSSPEVDIAVDPIDGTTLTALGRAGALSVIAVAPKGTMFNPGPCVYMDKIAVGSRGKGSIDMNKSITENVNNLADQLGQQVRDLTAVILERDRHNSMIEELRATGARIRLITDGDVAGAISTAWDNSGADILFGVGGTPEGVIAAAALKALGGELLGRLAPRNDAERDEAIRLGYDLDAILDQDDLIQGDNCFFSATGITDGELLQGVRFNERGGSTESLVMRSKSGTCRIVKSQHSFVKLSEFSAINF